MALIVVVHFGRRFLPAFHHATELDFLWNHLSPGIASAVSWFFQPVFLEYLLVTIPGTLVGDCLLEYSRPENMRVTLRMKHSRWRELSFLRCALLFALSGGIIISILVGIHIGRTLSTSLLALAMMAVGGIILFSPPSRRSVPVLRAGLSGQIRLPATMFRSIYLWGAVWLIIGLAILPYQGGIRKDPPTLSYLFLTAGMATLMLIGLGVLFEMAGTWKPLGLLTRNGQNPMMAYVAIGWVIEPVLNLIPIGSATAAEKFSELFKTPWMIALHGLIITLAAALMVAAASKLKLYWRT
jgi:hypothetical protein